MQRHLPDSLTDRRQLLRRAGAGGGSSAIVALRRRGSRLAFGFIGRSTLAVRT
jgi:hypothetical protein